MIIEDKSLELHSHHGLTLLKCYKYISWLGVNSSFKYPNIPDKEPSSLIKMELDRA